MGIHPPQKMTIERINKCAKKLNMTGSLYYADSVYLKGVVKKCAQDKKIMKNHLQPVQAIYFDGSGKMISYFINCYANPTLVNLNWNEGNFFSAFPPKTMAPIDTMFTYAELVNLLQPVTKTSTINSSSIKVLVFWNKMFYRYSKSLIRQVKKNTQHESNVEIIYINTDNYLLKF
jgi:hypothetical protein